MAWNQYHQQQPSPYYPPPPPHQPPPRPMVHPGPPHGYYPHSAALYPQPHPLYGYTPNVHHVPLPHYYQYPPVGHYVHHVPALHVNSDSGIADQKEEEIQSHPGMVYAHPKPVRNSADPLQCTPTEASNEDNNIKPTRKAHGEILDSETTQTNDHVQNDTSISNLSPSTPPPLVNSASSVSSSRRSSSDMTQSPSSLTRKKFACQICGKVLQRKENLIGHLRIHSGELPFHCENCGRKFRFRSGHKVHNRTCKYKSPTLAQDSSVRLKIHF